MVTGIVKRFSFISGSGLIQPDDGSNTVCVYTAAVEKAGLSTLNNGQKVEYELVQSRTGKTSAENLKSV